MAKQVTQYECETCKSIHSKNKFSECSYCGKEACNYCLYEFEREDGDIFFVTIHMDCLKGFHSQRVLDVKIFKK